MQLNEIVKRYIAIRDRKKELQAKHKAELANYDVALAKIEAKLQEYFNQSGVNSINTPDGTAYRKLETKVRVADREAWFDWIFQNNARAFLEAHVNSAAVKEFIDANDTLPPGLDITNIFQVRVNRP